MLSWRFLKGELNKSSLYRVNQKNYGNLSIDSNPLLFKVILDMKKWSYFWFSRCSFLPAEQHVSVEERNGQSVQVGHQSEQPKGVEPEVDGAGEVNVAQQANIVDQSVSIN